MARTTLYCVDTYQRDAGGDLVRDEHAVMKTAGDVRQRAEYLFLARRAAGAVAYEIDGPLGDRSVARVLVRLGETPDV